jgi:hypothetical protein
VPPQRITGTRLVPAADMVGLKSINAIKHDLLDQRWLSTALASIFSMIIFF